MTAPQIIDADARHDPQSDPSWQRADEKARAVLASGDYQWIADDRPNRVLLVERSPNTEEWRQYTLDDDSCGCPARVRWCWHRAFLSLFGGVAGVTHRIRMEAQRGTCRICGNDAPGRLLCKTCFDLEAARDTGGELPARKRGGRR